MPKSRSSRLAPVLPTPRPAARYQSPWTANSTYPSPGRDLVETAPASQAASLPPVLVRVPPLATALTRLVQATVCVGSGVVTVTLVEAVAVAPSLSVTVRPTEYV